MASHGVALRIETKQNKTEQTKHFSVKIRTGRGVQFNVAFGDTTIQQTREEQQTKKENKQKQKNTVLRYVQEGVGMQLDVALVDTHRV
jgi:hypothetical protein